MDNVKFQTCISGGKKKEFLEVFENRIYEICKLSHASSEVGVHTLSVLPYLNP